MSPLTVHALLPVLTLGLLTGCSGKPSVAKNTGKTAASTKVTIHWRETVNIDLQNIVGGKPDCQGTSLGNYFLDIFDESGKAVSGSTEVDAVQQHATVVVAGGLGTCAYGADFTVDRAQRYRAERKAQFDELYRKLGEVVDFGYVDAPKLEADGWVWSNK